MPKHGDQVSKDGIVRRDNMTINPKDRTFQFAQEIYSQLGADPALVSPVDTSAFPTVAKRPTYSVLDHSDFPAWGLQPMQNWQVGLSDSIESIRMAIQKEASL
jgi:dTDP-4-dehydrorhamnose reductase